MKPYQAKFATPFAVLGIRTEGGRVTGIDFLPPDSDALAPQDPLAERVCAQLRAYLQDPAFRFDLPLEPRGTAFQHKVWQALQEIPAGRTLTYGELAAKLDSAPRAVGQACGANPIPVIIPCHRVLARHGLGGFMNSTGGDPLSIKRWLLHHEHAG
ncbi:MAG: methylated-DNA--[protein]-cysteine S-methyltransferase [Pseudomonadota bacterium]|jgi:methylated-DNA-[protein]-cysteine S-methyltransferase